MQRLVSIASITFCLTLAGCFGSGSSDSSSGSTTVSGVSTPSNVSVVTAN